MRRSSGEGVHGGGGGLGNGAISSNNTYYEQPTKCAPGLVASEMQGDAATPPAVEAAVADLYARYRSGDHLVLDGITRILEEGKAELEGRKPPKY